MVMEEKWVSIIGFYDKYFISNTGKVKSINYRNTTNTILLTSRVSKWGYQYIGLSKNSKSYNFAIHRLVAKHFIPNPMNFEQVNHINEIKTDNRVENLEWCDRKYNINHGTGRARHAISCSKPIIQLSLDGQYIKHWESATIAETDTNVFDQGHISKCCKGQRKTHAGYKWIYA
jgi:hypothetical protein